MLRLRESAGRQAEGATGFFHLKQQCVVNTVYLHQIIILP